MGMQVSGRFLAPRECGWTVDPSVYGGSSRAESGDGDAASFTILIKRSEPCVPEKSTKGLTGSIGSGVAQMT